MKQADEISTRIHDWVTRTFPLAQERQLGIHDSLLDTGIIDSLGTLEAVQFLEDEFGVEVTDDEMVADHFDSVHSMTELVDSKQSRSSGNAEAK